MWASGKKVGESTDVYSDISGRDAGTDVSAAELEELTDASETTLHSHAAAAGGFDSCISVYRQTDQLIQPSTWTPVQFNGEFYDGLNEHDSVTNWRWTANDDGSYRMATFVSIKTLAAGKVCRCRFTKNGSAIVAAGPDGYAEKAVYGSYTSPKTFNSIAVVANDYIQVEVWHNDTTARNIGEDPCYFQLERFK